MWGTSVRKGLLTKQQSSVACNANREKVLDCASFQAEVFENCKWILIWLSLAKVDFRTLQISLTPIIEKGYILRWNSNEEESLRFINQ